MWWAVSHTVEPQLYNMARGQQNHIVKSGYHSERTPDLSYDLVAK